MYFTIVRNYTQNQRVLFLQRKQKDVQKENDFYINLLQQALPSEQHTSEKQKGNILPGWLYECTCNTELS